MTGEARVVVTAGPGASLDRRVTILEENLNRLRDEIDAKENKVRTELSTVKATVEQEQRARETEARRLSSQMEELAVGGLHLELVGLAWLILVLLEPVFRMNSRNCYRLVPHNRLTSG